MHKRYAVVPPTGSPSAPCGKPASKRRAANTSFSFPTRRSLIATTALRALRQPSIGTALHPCGNVVVVGTDVLVELLVVLDDVEVGVDVVLLLVLEDDDEDVELDVDTDVLVDVLLVVDDVVDDVLLDVETDVLGELLVVLDDVEVGAAVVVLLLVLEEDVVVELDVDTVLDELLVVVEDDVVEVEVVVEVLDVVLVVDDVDDEVVVVVDVVGGGSRIGWTRVKYAANAPSTVALSTASHESFTLVPHAPVSCPTTCPAALSTGEPLLPPSVAPKTSLL